MKRIIGEFVRRGMIASGWGPVVLAIVYFILWKQGIADSIPAERVCLGILSLEGLAFVAGGMNVIYQIEQLPLMGAILIHGAVLYISYLLTYLSNAWLEWGMLPVVAFTGIFAVAYLVIWLIIYSIIRRNTRRINALLQQKQRRTE